MKTFTWLFPCLSTTSWSNRKAGDKPSANKMKQGLLEFIERRKESFFSPFLTKLSLRFGLFRCKATAKGSWKFSVFKRTHTSSRVISIYAIASAAAWQIFVSLACHKKISGKIIIKYSQRYFTIRCLIKFRSDLFINLYTFVLYSPSFAFIRFHSPASTFIWIENVWI